MQSLNKTQRDKLTQFIQQTGASEKEAKECLVKAKWNLRTAVNGYKPAPAPSVSSLETVFNTYARGGQEIDAEGIQHLCSDLGIDPLDPVILVLALYMNAESMGVFRKEEFVRGLSALNCGSVQALKNKIPQLRSELDNPSRFKQLYVFVFAFSRDPGRRDVEYQTALALWNLLLAPRFSRVNEWIQFLEQRPVKHDVSKDTWNMIYDFLNILNKDGMDGYDPDGAWPVLIDEFAEFLKNNS